MLLAVCFLYLMDHRFAGIVNILILLLIIPTLTSERCQSKHQKTYMYLATKTPYRYVTNGNDSAIYFPGCNAVKIWMLVRHGTRYPSSKVIKKMQQKLPLLRDAIVHNHKSNNGKLCHEELTALQAWTPHVEQSDEKRLAHEGEDEMVELAERFQNRFPYLFPESYSNSSYKFRYTATQRTAESARHFAVGLFGRRVSRYVWFPEAVHRDPILRFYKLCSRWRTEVDKNPESLKERHMFEEGPEMTSALREVSMHLGFNHSLSLDEVYIMYLTCSFETAWDHRAASPWCSPFTEKNMKVFEYAEDLEYYWIDGYGYNITYKQACPAFKDMMQFFQTEEVPGATNSPKATLYFTHSGTILKMLAHLGLYKDENTLLHNNFHTMVKYRKWRVSQVDTFGTNIAFVLFRCSSGLHVLTLHQERPVNLPACPKSQLCPLDAIRRHYQESLFNCNFDQMCGISAPAA